MRVIGKSTGRTWRAHNLLAETRATDFIYPDARLRAIVEGVIGPYTQISIATLFNTLPGKTRLALHQTAQTVRIEMERHYGAFPAEDPYLEQRNGLHTRRTGMKQQ